MYEKVQFWQYSRPSITARLLFRSSSKPWFVFVSNSPSMGLCDITDLMKLIQQRVPGEMYPPVPRGELATQRTLNFQCIFYCSHNTVRSQSNSRLTTTEMHSDHSRFYVTDTQWVCTAACTPVTRSTKKDPSAAASV